MKTITLITTLASLVTGIAANSAKQEEKPIFDNYNYTFRSSSEFKSTNGDEFEMLNVQDGGRSAIEVENNENEKTTIKEYSSTPKIVPDAINNDAVALAQDFNDTREDNDAPEKASSMYDVGHWEEGIYQHASWLDATISQKTKGFWFTKETYIDKDFYSFDACTVGTMTVKLTNIPKNCDYDVRIYKMGNDDNAKASDIDFDKYIAIGNHGSNNDEIVSISVTPGTYFICVYSFQDKTYDNVNPYHLYVEELVNLNRDNVSYNINEGRNNGDIAAIWTSDYKPLGYTPISSGNNDAVSAQVKNYDTYPYIKHLSDKYTNGDYINYSVLYVWDLETRAILSAVAASMVDSINQLTDWDSTKSNKINFYLATAGFVLTVAGAVVTVLPYASAAIAASTMLAYVTGGVTVSSLAVSLAGLLIAAKSLNSTYISTKKDLLASFVSMQQTFAVGKGSNNKEVKILRYRYRFYKDGNTRYVDWSPFYLSEDYNFYNDDEICFQIKHSGIDGTVRGIKTQEEIKEIIGK